MRLNAIGQAVWSSSAGTGINTAFIDDHHATYAGWLTESLIAEQRQNVKGDDGSWAVMSMTPAGATSPLALHGASRVRSGDGVWAGWVPGWCRTSWGQLSDECGLLEVGDNGWTAITPVYQIGQDITLYDSGGAPQHTIITGPLRDDAVAGPNVRIRQGVVSYWDQSGWHLTTLDGDPRPMLDRPGVHYLVPMVIGGQVWLLERTGGESTGQLSLRPALSSEGIVVLQGGNAFEPDARVLDNALIGVCWTTESGALPDRVRNVQVDPSAPRVPLFDGPTPPDPPDPPDPPQPGQHRLSVSQAGSVFTVQATIGASVVVLPPKG